MTMNNFSLPLSPIDMNVDNPTSIDHQSLIHENDSIMPVSYKHEQHPSSSYLTLSVGDNRHFGLSDFQDPLFYQQPLHFHYNQSIPTTIESGHETGDRARLTNEIKFKEYRKQTSPSSRKHRIEKRKATHRQCTNSKNSKNKMIKAKEKKKKVSRENMNKRKHKSKKTNRSNIQRLRYQSKTRQALLLKRRRQQQMLLKKKKKNLLKQRITSKRRSMTKVNKNKSVTSTRHARKLNTTNNRVASTISSRRSLISRPTKARSITQSKTETTVSNKIKHRTDLSASKPMMNVTKHPPPTCTNILSSSCVHPSLFSKSSSSTRFEQKLSKKNIPRSKLNVKKLSTSKSKQVKQRNRDSTKLNIRSPIHTTFKKNVRRHRKRRSTGRKIKFPRCTSKTLITIAPTNTNDTNMMKSIDIHNDNIHTKTSPSLFSLRNNLTDKQSSTSAVMPLTKNTAQLTSKNNNKCTLKIKRPECSSISTTLGRKLKKEPTRTGMTLRSRIITINNVNATGRKGEKYK